MTPQTGIMKQRGNFIMVDGIDGSGKTAIVSAIADYYRQKGKRVLNLIEYQKRHETNPSLETIAEHDALISCEPTYCWVGAAIRKTIIRSDDRYPGRTVANAYALDREVQYREVIIPALKRNITVIQDRGVSTSLCYQPIQEKPVPVDEILALEGNRHALVHRPDLLILASCPAKTALARLAARSEKKDDSIFERAAFLERAAERFASNDFQSLFTARGTRVVTIDTSVPIDTVRRSVLDLIHSLYNV